MFPCLVKSGGVHGETRAALKPPPAMDQSIAVIQAHRNFRLRGHNRAMGLFSRPVVGFTYLVVVGCLRP